MSDRCVEVCARDCGLSEGGDVVATRRLTRSTSKEIQVCLHLLYFDLLERIERPLGHMCLVRLAADKDAASLAVGMRDGTRPRESFDPW